MKHLTNAFYSEGKGFEPLDAFTSPVFKTGALDPYANPLLSLASWTNCPLLWRLQVYCNNYYTNEANVLGTLNPLGGLPYSILRTKAGYPCEYLKYRCSQSFWTISS